MEMGMLMKLTMPSIGARVASMDLLISWVITSSTLRSKVVVTVIGVLTWGCCGRSEMEGGALVLHTGKDRILPLIHNISGGRQPKFMILIILVRVQSALISAEWVLCTCPMYSESERLGAAVKEV